MIDTTQSGQQVLSRVGLGIVKREATLNETTRATAGVYEFLAASHYSGA